MLVKSPNMIQLLWLKILDIKTGLAHIKNGIKIDQMFTTAVCYARVAFNKQ